MKIQYLQIQKKFEFDAVNKNGINLSGALFCACNLIDKCFLNEKKSQESFLFLLWIESYRLNIMVEKLFYNGQIISRNEKLREKIHMNFFRSTIINFHFII